MKIPRIGPQLLAGTLIGFLFLFLVVQLWYQYLETERTKDSVRKISKTYDDRIREIKSLPTTSTVPKSDEIIKLSFLKEFRNQKEWEQSHERVNRRFSTFISLSEWFLALFILWLAVLNEYGGARAGQVEQEERPKGGVPNSPWQKCLQRRFRARNSFRISMRFSPKRLLPRAARGELSGTAKLDSVDRIPHQERR